MLLFPSFERIYCFDTRAPLQNGALRVTIWDAQTHTNMLALPNAVYFAQTDGIADYATHQDNGSSYRMKYFTTYFDFGSASQFKILKRLATTVIGGSGQDFVLKAGFDYTDSYQSYPATLSTKTVSEYGEDEYNVAEYESGTLVEVVRSASGGTGNVLQIGFESNVNGAELSLQKLDIFVKQGRVF